MNIACELTYRMDKAKWRSMTMLDPFVWPYINALKRLGDDGHKVMMFGVSDHDDLYLDPPTGVHFKLSHSFGVHKESMQAFEPDILLSLTTPHLAESDAGYLSSKASIKILRVCAEVCKHLTKEAFKAYNESRVIVVSMDYEVPILQSYGINANVVAIEHGVNKAWIESLRQPKEYDFVGACWSKLKGFGLIDEVLNLLSLKGFKVHPWKNLNSMDRTTYITELSKCRYLFHPTISEGSARTPVEAVYCGTVPIVSTDSQNVCRQLVGVHHHEVRTWAWADTVQDKVSYFRPASELADELARIAESERGHKVTMALDDKYTSQVETRKWYDLISGLTVGSK